MRRAPLRPRAPQPSPPVVDPEGFMRDIEDLVNDNMDNGVFNLANLEIANVLSGSSGDV